MQRHIELIIGRLLTDEQFRSAFLRDARQALAGAEDGGLFLSPYEVTALLATDRSMWERMARELHQLSRLDPATVVIGPAASENRQSRLRAKR